MCSNTPGENLDLINFEFFVFKLRRSQHRTDTQSMFILENVSIVVITSVVVLLLCPRCARAPFFHAASENSGFTLRVAAIFE